MNKETYGFTYDIFDSIDDLNEQDAALLKASRETTAAAYAPYSNFKVGAVALLVNGEIVKGTNQENASYPVGICAERGLLATAATLFPDTAINTLAITYNNVRGKSEHPISPCGMCRQSLVEYEERVNHPIRLLLSGLEGKVLAIEKASLLLPLSFGSTDLK